MRVKSSDDDNDDIMDLSEAINLADDESYQPLENEMSAVKKEPKVTKPAGETVKKAKVTKPAGEAKGTFGPREVPEGHTGIASLAAETGLTAAAIRRRLRTMEGVAKPEGQHGWYWKDNSRELTAVRKALAAAPAA